MGKFPVSNRVANIEYAIRDVVIPAMELERKGNTILKLNIGDPLVYPGFKTPSHMIDAFSEGLKNQNNGYSPSYGLPELRQAIALEESRKKNGIIQSVQSIWEEHKEDGWDEFDSEEVCRYICEKIAIKEADFLSDKTKDRFRSLYRLIAERIRQQQNLISNQNIDKQKKMRV